MKQERPIEGYSIKNMSSEKKERLLKSLKTKEYETYITKKKATQKRQEKIAKFGVVGLIIILNVILYLPQLLSQDWMLENLGQRSIHDSNFHIYQLFTSMWLHSGIIHLALNMITLWFLGRPLQKMWYNYKFIFIYILSGLGGAILALMFGSIYPSNLIGVGASGAICGLLGAFYIIHPDAEIRLLFFIPMKVKKMVQWFAGISLVLALFNWLPFIGHSAHLGGLIVGYLITLYWKKTGNLYTTFIK